MSLLMSCLLYTSIVMAEALKLVQKKLVNVIAELSKFADKYKEQPTLAFTHFQPAQPTTVGKRATLWTQEFLMDLEDLEYVMGTLKLLGSKGTTGTQASFLEPVSYTHLLMMNRQMSGGGGNAKMMNFGKSRARMMLPDDKKVTFQNVAGLQEEKEDLVEVVDFLKAPQKYTNVGARIPKGVILVGPPGTGKTLLAKAVAGEAGVPFFSISGSDFVEMFVGVGASRVRDLFGEGKKHAPYIIRCL